MPPAKYGPNFMSNPVKDIFEGNRLFLPAETEQKPKLSDLTKNPVAIYGLGECAHWFHEVGLKRLGIKPLVALDQTPNNTEWFGVKTSTPMNFIKQTQISLNDIEVIVSVGTRLTYNSIKILLNSIGFTKVHFLHDFYEFHSFFVSDPEEVRHRIQKNKKNFQIAYQLISDEISKEIFCRLLQVHSRLEPLDIPASPREQQYFPKDIPFFGNYQTYVCCGAYDGENITRLAAQIGETETILCFEPEPKIYSKLTDCARQHIGRTAQNIICFHNAVSCQNGIQPFISGDGLGSRLDETGKDYAQCVTLDDALLGFKPTFISMDIEGSEVAAIKGGRRLITQNLPDLGICVYHYPEQIAEVIQTINSIHSGYQFYVRNYTGYLTETVVYASTKNQLN